MYYSGIDQHKRDSFITTYDSNGTVVKQMRVANDPLLIQRYFAEFPGPHKAVVESTGAWYWLADLLEEHNVELTLAHATQLKAISAAKVKTDKVDSDILAQLLRADLIPNEDIQRLLWIPGIGKIGAFTIYTEIDGIERFPSAKRFFSYCRLVPGADNSAGKTRHRSGSKAGNCYLKLAFSHAGVRAVRYYPKIKAFYKAKLRRKPQRIARTLVSLEIARIVYQVLKTREHFNGHFKKQQLSRRKQSQWPRLASPAA